MESRENGFDKYIGKGRVAIDPKGYIIRNKGEGASSGQKEFDSKGEEIDFDITQSDFHKKNGPDEMFLEKTIKNNKLIKENNLELKGITKTTDDHDPTGKILKKKDGSHKNIDPSKKNCHKEGSIERNTNFDRKATSKSKDRDADT
jgi:hypothetical protein